METFRKRLVGNKNGFYTLHWRLIAAIFDINLTPTEMLFLVEFMSIRTDEFIFDATSRHIVMERMGIKASHMTNYLNRLMKKGILETKVVMGKTTKVVKQQFIPNPDLQDYLIRNEYAGD